MGYHSLQQNTMPTDRQTNRQGNETSLALSFDDLDRRPGFIKSFFFNFLKRKPFYSIIHVYLILMLKQLYKDVELFTQV